MEKYDYIVIGAGSGLDVANALSQTGRVAIIEKDKMGGTCLNRGCIPSKVLIHSANVAETIKKAPIFGINVKEFSVDLKKMMKRTYDEFIDQESSNIKESLKDSDNPVLFDDKCKFVDSKVVKVGNSTISAKKILIAAGSRPKIPNIKGLKDIKFLTSDQALRLEQLPEELTIIGGGYIACEMAHFFGCLGSKINIIQRRQRLLNDEDSEIAQRFTEVFSKKYNIYTNSEPQEVTKDGNKYTVTIKDKRFGKTSEIKSDKILIATGRQPNSDTLDLQKTGVNTNNKGHIISDEYLETSQKGIFVLGDIAGKYEFKHSANLEAKYAFYNMTHDKKKKVNYTAMPHAIFSSPQIAGVGQREQDLEKNSQYDKTIFSYNNTGMGKAIEDNDGFVKLLTSKDDKKILGCHIIGTDASTLIHEVLVSMKTGTGTIFDISETVHIHPALSEVVSKAAIQARNK